MLDSSLLAALREKALAATPGPWFADFYSRTIIVTKESSAFSRGHFIIAKVPMRTSKSLVSHIEWTANAQMISAANPQVILQLIEEIERLRKELNEAEQGMQYLLDDAECEFYREQAKEFLDRWNRKSP